MEGSRMKGIVFTEFLEMIESERGLDTVDRLLEVTDLTGAYTAVGTYDHEELVALATALSEETGIAVSELVQAFGRHLFTRFVVAYPQFFEGVPDAMEFLSRIEDYIHVEVRKLYPDAELPTFDHVRGDGGSMELVYRSPRPLGDFAKGLVEGCVKYFGGDVQVTCHDESREGETRMRFRLKAGSPV